MRPETFHHTLLLIKINGLYQVIEHFSLRKIQWIFFLLFFHFFLFILCFCFFSFPDSPLLKSWLLPFCHPPPFFHIMHIYSVAFLIYLNLTQHRIFIQNRLWGFTFCGWFFQLVWFWILFPSFENYHMSVLFSVFLFIFKYEYLSAYAQP